MPRIVKKENKNSPKLYHGTTESIAKFICAKGLTPYDVGVFDNGTPRVFCASSVNGACLTSIYPALMAFDTSIYREKWGIIEIDVTYLEPEFFLPYEGFLVEKIKTRLFSEEDRLKKFAQLRQSLPNHRRKWRESLDNYGVCVYEKEIPVNAISKVTIYDPTSNPVMTKAMTSSSLMGSRFHQSNMHRQGMITRWLLGENVTAEEWLGSTTFQKMQHAERDKIAQVLRNKNGLDIFYSGLSSGRKANWW